ncbi:hypothetical protein J9231_07085 [Providencia rettgeri]|uniref:hypothetical protein n=1 Tax=Providencia rettgeri TaxID=587 RepID=UPI0019D2B548|nr:hypothetical protein [Providencia rettgeri]MBN6363915.1 hypothetical protein [Providencia rettgeri]MBQ0327613.1 hypothetical protein [Providencia rettgeri]
MAETKQVKISKLFKHGKQIGYCLTVDGQMLANQKQVSINTYPLDASVDVEFVWRESTVTDAPDIHLK